MSRAGEGIKKQGACASWPKDLLDHLERMGKAKAEFLEEIWEDILNGDPELHLREKIAYHHQEIEKHLKLKEDTEHQLATIQTTIKMMGAQEKTPRSELINEILAEYTKRNEDADFKTQFNRWIWTRFKEDAANVGMSRSRLFKSLRARIPMVINK